MPGGGSRPSRYISPVTLARMYLTSDRDLNIHTLRIGSQSDPLLLACRMELRDPRDFYLETMRSVLVGAYFLTRAKQSPNSTKGDVWRYLRKECGYGQIEQSTPRALG